MKNKILILLLLVIYSCNDKKVSLDDFSYVKINTLVLDKGFKIGEGDFISFDDDDNMIFLLKNDTIYYKNIPKAIIRKVEKKNYELTISSFDGKNSGLYINIEEFTR